MNSFVIAHCVAIQGVRRSQLLINGKSIHYLVNIWSISAGKIDPPQYNICFLKTFETFKPHEDQRVSEKREHMVPKNTLIAAEQSKL